MPLYEYQCSSCKYSFTEMYRIDDRKTPCNSKCPTCEANTVELVITNSVGILADTLLKPRGDFKEVMQKVKKAHKYDRIAKIKDY